MQICVLLAALFSIVMATNAAEDGSRWWPVQTLPKAFVRTANQQEFPAPRLAHQMLVQSISGLAAKAVNEGKGDQLVWVENGNADLDDWLARWRAAHPEITAAGPFGPWELAEHFQKLGVIKGYILYRADKSRGEINSHRPSMDCSVNVATSLSGILDGIIVDESLEKDAISRGFKLVVDARDKTQAWCFEKYKDQFNRKMLCAQDPKKPHIRDLAIAHRTFTVFGSDEPTPSALAWLEPLSPILGWNGGDEFLTTDLSTRWGHFQTATDWCMNLPLLMSGSQKDEPTKIKSYDPAVIDWNDKRSAVSFVQTDGDNVQWLQGNFFRHPSYWGDPNRGRIPFGWSSCFAHLVQLVPQAIDFAKATATANDSFIEWGGGYYYPDHFGMNRPNRWELLALHARRTWTLMKQNNTRIIGFNVHKFDSADARKAYEVFARETDGLLGILVFQYDPYEAGAGKIFWVKDRNGIDVPVISARYSIWEHANNRPRAGTPAKVAREIRESGPRYDWVITHVWSYFKKAPGDDENAENLPQGNARSENGVRGYTPVTWCAERLPTNTRVVSPEELIWRIRMQHDPAQTRGQISAFKK